MSLKIDMVCETVFDPFFLENLILAMFVVVIPLPGMVNIDIANLSENEL